MSAHLSSVCKLVAFFIGFRLPSPAAAPRGREPATDRLGLSRLPEAPGAAHRSRYALPAPSSCLPSVESLPSWPFAAMH